MGNGFYVTFKRTFNQHEKENVLKERRRLYNIV